MNGADTKVSVSLGRQLVSEHSGIFGTYSELPPSKLRQKGLHVDRPIGTTRLYPSGQVVPMLVRVIVLSDRFHFENRDVELHLVIAWIFTSFGADGAGEQDASALQVNAMM
jgi:hypothetical protein